ncbi:MAG TPA: OmpA family protein [Sphingomicrobium sp.]|nr:OmpA family protein [Sphingomicrobium sp.]
MPKTPALIVALALVASSASAQLPGLRKYTPADRQRQQQQQQPLLTGIDALRADFAAQSGATTVYFGSNSAILAPQAKSFLTAQAAWLRRHPDVVVRIEGYGDSGDTRDHALAMGAARAAESRDFLILLGVPTAQVSTTSWGKERPGLGRAVTVLVQ